MPECSNCDAAVSEAYVRVFAPPGAETVAACPRCPDMKRGTNGRPREYRENYRGRST